jgi:hypothetical protein
MKSIPLHQLYRSGWLAWAAVVRRLRLPRLSAPPAVPNHAAEAAAAGGMYAGGDWILEIMIGCMLLAPTFVLALVVRKSEPLSAGYSRVMLGLSLTAPISLGLVSIPAVGQGTMLLGWICMDRLMCSPVVIVGLLVSRLVSRFDRAKRLTLYALLIEVFTLALTVGLFLFAASTQEARPISSKQAVERHGLSTSTILKAPLQE